MKSLLGVVLTLMLLALFSPGVAGQEIIHLNVTYICNGEQLEITGCDVGNATTDDSVCTLAYPDRPLHNRMMVYGTATRGELKKLLPACKQPSKEEIARVDAERAALQKRHEEQDKKALAESKAIVAQNDAMLANKLKETEDQRALARCISSGRTQGQCLQDSLAKGFKDMVNGTAPGLIAERQKGLRASGLFEGAGGWHIELDAQAAVKCGDGLVPDLYDYSVELRNGRPLITIQTKPRPLVLAVRPDGKLIGAAPFRLDGKVVTGTHGGSYGSSGGQLTTTMVTTQSTMSAMDAASAARSGATVVSQSGAGTTVSETNPVTSFTPATPQYIAPTVDYGPKSVTCPAPLLSARAGAMVHADPVKAIGALLDPEGAKASQTPAGLRLEGAFVGQGGMSIEFHPESASVGCGEAVVAHPYTVEVTDNRVSVRIQNERSPIVLAVQPDGTLVGSGPVEVRGRTLVGRAADGSFQYVPRTETCALGLLTLGGIGAVPSGQRATASSQQPAATETQAPITSASTTKQPPTTGNAVLSLVGFPKSGGDNPLTGHVFLLLKEPFDNVLLKGGVQPPAGKTPMQAWMLACDQGAPICRQALANLGASAAGAIRMDAAGKGTFAEVPPGAYYLFGSGVVNGKPRAWTFPVHLAPGKDSLTIDQSNVTQF